MISVFAPPRYNGDLLIGRHFTILQDYPLILRDILIMISSALTSGFTYRIDKHLDLVFVIQIVQDIPSVVKVIIQDNVFIILIKFRIQRVNITYLLTRGRIYRI